ncbi:MAG: hypothetical protein CM15mP62_04930 [Rhodospirillaceae bacterium]|nr:MAG: hypothetical protein CM15mP62_04930 [Rhodospirillaceae bacterium]
MRALKNATVGSDDPELDIDKDLYNGAKILRPEGIPWMAEVGNMGLPSKVLKRV